ncbi:hypothetical protein T484DRAFT_1581766, partial [Baffinella frigidus]
YVRIYGYVCIYVRIYVHICIDRGPCLGGHSQRIYVRIYVHIFIYVRIYVHICICIYAYMYMDVWL